jgi:hypothetical protein
MNAISARGQIGERTVFSLYSTIFQNEATLQSSAFFDRGNRTKFNNDPIYANFFKLLFTKPIAATAVAGVGASFVLCETNIKRSAMAILPDINIHYVLPVNDCSEIVP